MTLRGGWVTYERFGSFDEFHVYLLIESSLSFIEFSEEFIVDVFVVGEYLFHAEGLLVGERDAVHLPILS